METLKECLWVPFSMLPGLQIKINYFRPLLDYGRISAESAVPQLRLRENALTLLRVAAAIYYQVHVDPCARTV